MPTTFHHVGIWTRISKLARGRKGYVAVAYLSKGARRLLPLRKGSVLVVDMSQRAVESGQTNPGEIIKFIEAGILAYSIENLHAKVFVLGRTAIVGSTNASSRSARVLQEAAVEVTDPTAVAAAREYVLSRAVEPILREHAVEMAKLFREPRVPGGKGRRKRLLPKLKAGVPAHAPIWVTRLEREDWDSDDYDQAKHARPVASKRTTRREDLDEFRWSGPPFYERAEMGDLVVQVVDEVDGVFVYPPGRIVLLHRYVVGRSRRVLAYLAVPTGVRRKRINRVRKLLGSHAKVTKVDEARLVRNAEAAHSLLSVWRTKR